MKRREFLRGAGAAGAAVALGRPVMAGGATEPGSAQEGMTLGFGTYGMPNLSLEEGIRAVAEIGFDAVEISLLPARDLEPAQLTPKRRAGLRQLLGESGLHLTALMEHIKVPVAGELDARGYLDQLEGAMELAHDLAPDGAAPPLIEFAPGGGKEEDWERLRLRFLELLPGWTELAEKNGIVIAIKPHRGGGLSRPEQAVALIRELGDSPWLRMNYDYSHYAFREPPIDLVESIVMAAPYTAFVAVKDTVIEEDGRARFRLPGESGQIDYPLLLKTFSEAGYRGDISCEVSAQVWKQEGFDDLAAAKTCYANMRAAFEEAGV